MKKEMGFKYLLKYVSHSCSDRSDENFFSMAKEKGDRDLLSERCLCIILYYA